MSDELSRVMNGPGAAERSPYPIFWFFVEAADPIGTARGAREVRWAGTGGTPVIGEGASAFLLRLW
jgi:hypothetical protein